MDIIKLIERQDVAIYLSSTDLMRFAEHLIKNQPHEGNQEQEKDVQLLSKSEVMQLCNVCHSTLWHWANKGYLKPIKLGHKVFYRKSDLEQILKGK